jgi:cytochrome c-type biogenesis protein CcmH/NrfG
VKSISSSIPAREFCAQLRSEGNPQTALHGIEQVIAADPRDWRAYDYHGRVLWQLNKLADAAKAFATCLRINPLALDAWLALASVLTQQKKP